MKIVIATGGIADLAEWIIDDTFYFFQTCSGLLQLLSKRSFSQLTARITGIHSHHSQYQATSSGQTH